MEKSERPLHTPFQRLLIMDTVRRKKTPCHDKVFFTEQIDKNGWCVTCVNGSKPGEPGYCGSDMNHNEDDDNTEYLNEDIESLRCSCKFK